MSLKNYKALQFDCYGTLIDWEQGMVDSAPILQAPGGPSRQKFLTVFGQHENRIQVERPGTAYPVVLKEAYLATARDLGVSASDAEATAFGNAVPSWPAFPDSAAALKKLSDLGLQLVILSNVNNASFNETRKKLEKGFTFDAVYTAENIGSYKPSLANFNYSIDHIKSELGVDKDEILVTANSKLHDIKPGHAMGMKGAWISRAAHGSVMGVTDYADVEPDWVFPTMQDFADEMEKVRA